MFIFYFVIESHCILGKSSIFTLTLLDCFKYLILFNPDGGAEDLTYLDDGGYGYILFSHVSCAAITIKIVSSLICHQDNMSVKCIAP